MYFVQKHGQSQVGENIIFVHTQKNIKGCGKRMSGDNIKRNDLKGRSSLPISNSIQVKFEETCKNIGLYKICKP